MLDINKIKKALSELGQTLWQLVIQLVKELSAILAAMPKDTTTKKPTEKPSEKPSQTPKPNRPTKLPVPTTDEPMEIPEDKPKSEPKRKKGKKGFDGSFLTFPLSLPRLEDENKVVLTYRNFTVVMNPERKMPYFTAVNIDSIKYNKLKPQIPSRKEMGSDAWLLDPRLDKSAQLAKSFYSKNDFDLGHMVRREDALWGDTLDEALEANDDTFFLTNATPQHKDFNRNTERWKGLEDYALSNARKNNLKLSVFTGCIFDENDRVLNGVQIPAKFWKVIVMIKKDGTPSATGYIVNQADLIEDITKKSIFVFQKFKTYQVSLKTIENQTGLAFGLGRYDPLQRDGRWGLMADMPVEIEEDEQIEF